MTITFWLMLPVWVLAGSGVAFWLWVWMARRQGGRAIFGIERRKKQ